jgi:hypothetical protein
MRLLDIHHEVKDVLALHGIKPEIERIGSGHVRFRWIVGGKTQTQILAMSPSDWRASRNEVARVRRKLKEAGVKKIIRCEQTKQPTTVPASEVADLRARVERLERDVELLLDRLTNPQLVPPPEPEPAPPPAPAPKIDQRKGHRANYDWLWRVMRYDEYLPASKIAEDAGRDYAPIAVLLTTLKKRELVEHRPRIGWRKHINVELLATRGETNENDKSARSNRSRDRGARSYVSPPAQTVANGPCQQGGRHLPASAEIRKRQESNQRQSVDEDCRSTGGRARNLVRQRSGKARYGKAK